MNAFPLDNRLVFKSDRDTIGFWDCNGKENDNPTIGLILCTKKDSTVVKYSLLNESKQIFASKYMTYLPTEKELEEEIGRERKAIEMEKKLKK